MTPLFTALAIFFLRVTDITVYIFRLQAMRRGVKLLAWVLGFAQSLLFVTALRQVAARLDDWLLIAAYAAGFATGNVVGMLFEGKIGGGQMYVRIISTRLGAVLQERLTEAGYRVHVFPGRGRDGTVDILTISLPKRQAPRLRAQVRAIDPQAFITGEEVRVFAPK